VKKKKTKTDPDAKLLDEIIRQNTALMNQVGLSCETCGQVPIDADTRFKAQDRILKALALKARKGKQGGSKFDLGDSAADDE
jgi:hypothetical protein